MFYWRNFTRKRNIKLIIIIIKLGYGLFCWWLFKFWIFVLLSLLFIIISLSFFHYLLIVKRLGLTHCLSFLIIRLLIHWLLLNRLLIIRSLLYCLLIIRLMCWLLIIRFLLYWLLIHWFLLSNRLITKWIIINSLTKFGQL